MKSSLTSGRPTMYVIGSGVWKFLWGMYSARGQRDLPLLLGPSINGGQGGSLLWHLVQDPLRGHTGS